MCPSCKETISLRALRQRMNGILLLSLPKPGIICGRCGQRLALHTGRSGAVVAAAMTWFFGVGVFFGVAQSKSLVGLVVAAIPLLLAYRYAPALARVSIPERGDGRFYFADAATNMLDRTAEARRKAGNEAREEFERIREINALDRSGWTCGCGAENTSTFDICWQCANQRVPE